MFVFIIKMVYTIIKQIKFLLAKLVNLNKTKEFW